jgi:catechol 1,2-dioxygenase
MIYMSSVSHLTETVINATGGDVEPRTREIITSLIRHLHGFVTDVSLTLDELVSACAFLVEAGKISTRGRNEFVLMANILGVEVLVDMIGHGPNSQTAILGPMYPQTNAAGETTAFIEGFVTGTDSLPVPGARLEVWQASTNGLYDIEDPEQPDMNLRGVFTTDQHGYYALRCLRPTPYPIPDDGPGGRLLELLKRHPMRPAHVHFLISAEGKQPIVSQLYDASCRFVDNDSIFAVKAPLVLEFETDNGRHGTDLYVRYDWQLANASSSA